MLQDSLRLCYVEGNFAWFTSHFEEEWGDDWGCSSYEHSASRPRGYHYTKLKESVPHEVFKVAFDGPFDQPSFSHTNSPYSVDDINAGVVPWLNVWPIETGNFVRGGATLKEFVDFVKRNDGIVYFPMQEDK